MTEFRLDFGNRISPTFKSLEEARSNKRVELLWAGRVGEIQERVGQDWVRADEQRIAWVDDCPSSPSGDEDLKAQLARDETAPVVPWTSTEGGPGDSGGDEESERWMVDYEHGDGEPQHAVLSWLSTDPTTALPRVGTELVRRRDFERMRAERDSRLTKESVVEWLESDPAFDAIHGDHRRADIQDRLIAAFEEQDPGTPGEEA